MCNCKHTAADFRLVAGAPFDASLVKFNSESRKIALQDVEYMAESFPDTFSIPEREIRESISIGMMAKIIVEWGMEDLPRERFWFEVTSTQSDELGNLAYYGVVRNNTKVAPWGSKIGPIYIWNICDVDEEEFLNRQGVKPYSNYCKSKKMAE